MIAYAQNNVLEVFLDAFFLFKIKISDKIRRFDLAEIIFK